MATENATTLTLADASSAVAIRLLHDHGDPDRRAVHQSKLPDPFLLHPPGDSTRHQPAE